MEERVSGNSFVFCLFRTFNLCLILVGLGVMASGIYVSIEDKSFDWYNGSFIGLGILTIILAILGHKSRYSQGILTFYCVVLFLIGVGMVGFTIGIISYSDFSNKLGDQNADGVRYSLLAGCILILITWLLACCYRRSIKWANFYEKNDPKKNYIKMPKVTPKTDKKREELNKKYSGLKNG
jgi:hypothetical protein